MNALGADELHVWLTDPERIPSHLLSRYDALLTPQERARVLRFAFDKGRRECLVTRALVRTTLSMYAPVAPAAWRFVIGAHGRPDVAPGVTDLPLVFNLSHTEGLIACAVALSRDVGVDVEWLERRGGGVEVADRFFSPDEVRALYAQPEPARRERFFSYWTLKESYIKARGLGLALPLDKFSFDLDRGAGIAIRIDPELGDDPASWQFHLTRPDTSHMLAACVRRGPGAPVRISVQWTVPLDQERIGRR